jgi:glycosyltransferase involved in cell wall biosynthesis
VPMSRKIGLHDLAAVAHVSHRVANARPDVVHGHGAKGGAYARIAGRRGAVRAYTPHGGSLHYTRDTPSGFVYLSLERALMHRTDLFLFESAYSREVFRRKVEDPGSRARVVYNGVAPGEFAPVESDARAADIVFVGELRLLKGVDVLIYAIARLKREGRNMSAVIVGDGPDRAMFEAMVRSEALDDAVQFVGAKPARSAFALGRVLIVPSRAESLPYVVLEAAAAGMPMVATKVGGIPEIFGPDADALVPPGDAAALARAIDRAVSGHTAEDAIVARLQGRLRTSFSTEAMTDAILAAYGNALQARSR